MGFALFRNEVFKLCNATPQRLDLGGPCAGVTRQRVELVSHAVHPACLTAPSAILRLRISSRVMP